MVAQGRLQLGQPGLEPILLAQGLAGLALVGAGGPQRLATLFLGLSPWPILRRAGVSAALVHGRHRSTKSGLIGPGVLSISFSCVLVHCGQRSGLRTMAHLPVGWATPTDRRGQAAPNTLNRVPGQGLRAG